MGEAGCWDDGCPMPSWTCPADVLQAPLRIEQSRALIFLVFPPAAMWLDNPHLRQHDLVSRALTTINLLKRLH